MLPIHDPNTSSPRGRLRGVSAREILDQRRRLIGRVAGRQPRRELAGAARSRWVVQRALDRQLEHPRRAQASWDAHADAAPSRSARRSRPCRRRRARINGTQPWARAHPSVPEPAVHDDHVGARQRVGVAHPLHEPCVGGHRRRPPRAAPRPAPAPAAARTPRAPRAAASARGSCDVDGAITTSGPSPGGGAASALTGGAHSSGPTTCTPGRPRARVLELRERRDQRQLSRQRPERPRHRRQPEPPPRLVELLAPQLPAAVGQRLQRAPERPPASVRGIRAPIENGGRPARRPRVQVRDQRRDPDPAPLGGQRRRDRQHVVDQRVGSNSASSRPSRAPRARPRHRAEAAARRSETACTRARGRTSCPAPRRASASAPTSAARRRGPARRARRPSAIAGKAWPGSPNAPRTSRSRVATRPPRPAARSAAAARDAPRA